MQLVASQPRLRTYRGMESSNSKPQPSAAVRAYAAAIRRLRVTAHLTQEEAAARMEVSKQAWQQYEAAGVKSVLNLDTQERIVAALGSSLEELHRAAAQEQGAGAKPVGAMSQLVEKAREAAMLPIRDRVQAGAWLLADDVAQMPRGTYPVVKDSRYPYADQWLSEVVGDSVDRLNIFDGDLVHVVDAIGIGYWPQTGHVVEVERVRFGGLERELTIKQVEVTESGVLLWPRSTNVRWREPLQLTDGVRDGEEIEVRIRSLVLASIRRF